jgi:hypothetical protein
MGLLRLLTNSHVMGPTPRTIVRHGRPSRSCVPIGDWSSQLSRTVSSPLGANS